jgi:hypothetical protein
MAIPLRLRSLMLISLFVLVCQSVLAQGPDSLNTLPEPSGGINKLALHFLKINFTPTQRSILDHTKLELIFFVDSRGKAELEKVNGITDQLIVDSLQRKTTQLPPFKPARIDGEVVDGIYSMLLTYPTYKTRTFEYNDISRSYHRLTREDFETYQPGGRFDILIGGLVNGFVGTAHDYLQLGGGAKIDLTIAGKKGFGGGLMMNIYGNGRKKEYPIDPARFQESTSTSVGVGLMANKIFRRNDRTSWLVQFEPAFLTQNISAKQNNQDQDNVQFKGFSPGLTLHYMKRIGEERFTTTYNAPTLLGHYINFHAGIRPLFYNNSAGSGVMLEAGVSYRMLYYFLNSYTLKE